MLGNGSNPCLAICTPVECHCFAGGSLFSWHRNWWDGMGVFLGITVRESPCLLLFCIHFQDQEAWREIISTLQVSVCSLRRDVWLWYFSGIRRHRLIVCLGDTHGESKSELDHLYFFSKIKHKYVTDLVSLL